MSPFRSLSILLILMMPFIAWSQPTRNVYSVPWSSVMHSQPAQWFSSEEARTIAENVLLYQRDCGGWPKNTEMHRPLSAQGKDSLRLLKSNTDDATTDNGATIQEMLYLAKMYAAVPQASYRAAFSKGLNYLLQAQYPNGGWPQFYPLRPGYYTHITFNDNSMANIMNVMHDIYLGRPPYSAIADQAIAPKARTAFNKGVECILKAQYAQNGVLTVWCAQHDENTLLPAKARSYELPSLSGSESTGLVQLLMDIENPSPEVIKAIDAAIAWFRNNKIEGLRSERFTNEQGLSDYRMVPSPGAPALWARFYTLEDNRPFFCDRDGIMKLTLAEIGHERRNGYSWYGTWPQSVLDAYPAWKTKNP